MSIKANNANITELHTTEMTTDEVTTELYHNIIANMRHYADRLSTPTLIGVLEIAKIEIMATGNTEYEDDGA